MVRNKLLPDGGDNGGEWNELSRLEQASLASGVLAVIIAMSGIFLAIFLSPSFEWTVDSLSSLGGEEGAVNTPVTNLVFNGGLFIGGIVFLPFLYRLYQRVNHPVEIIGAGLIGLTSINMAVIGYPFSLPHPLHHLYQFHSTA